VATVPPWDPADPAVAELVGTTWHLEVFWDAGTPPMAIAPPTPSPTETFKRPTLGPTLVFEQDGTISGRAMCNTFGSGPGSAPYRVGPGRTLTLGALLKTAEACSRHRAVDEAEDRFVGGVRAARRYQFADGRLTLLDGNDRPLMTLVADPAWLTPATPPPPTKP
jgi:heat shock protein HslJ